ncbi:MAG: hypothetical protein ACFFCW_34995, partial [Candidatus Hodarchaeota archaeon]
WDFDWSQEPEFWAERRINLQNDLVKCVLESSFSIKDVEASVKSAIDTEKDRRETAERLEKERRERAEQERSRLEQDVTEYEAKVITEENTVTEHYTKYAALLNRLEEGYAERLEQASEKQLQNFKRLVVAEDAIEKYRHVLKPTAWEMEAAFELFYHPQGLIDRLTGALNNFTKLNQSLHELDSDQADPDRYIIFNGQRICVCCGLSVEDTLADRKHLMQEMEVELVGLKEDNRLISEIQRELKTEMDLIYAHQGELTSARNKLALLKAQQKAEENLRTLDEETPEVESEDEDPTVRETDLSGLTVEEAKAKMSELKEQINERLDDVIEVGNKILREETDHPDPWAQYKHDLQCARCGGTIKRGEPFEEVPVFEDNKEVTKFMHKTCPEPTEQTNECPWCSKEINKDQIISEIPVFVNGVEKSLMIHDPCYDALLDAPCAGCDDSISEDEPSVFVLDEDTVMRYHANCALINKLIPDFSSASDMSSKEEDNEDSFEVKSEFEN